MQIKENIETKLPKSKQLLNEEEIDDFEDNWEYAIQMLESFRDGIFLTEMEETNKQSQINTMDFLNFIRPDTRAVNAEQMYGRGTSSVATPHLFSPDTKQVKWDDVFATNPSFTTTTKKSNTNLFNYDSKPVNPRSIMKAQMKVNKGKTHRVDSNTKSSKWYLWFDRARRILNDIDSLILKVQDLMQDQ